MAIFGRNLLRVVAGVSALAAQSEHPAFEVASVKPNNSADFRNTQLQFLPGGKLIIRNIPLLTIVAPAHEIPFQSPRLTGGPEWERAARERYDIEATAEKGTIAADLTTKMREAKIRLMLQSVTGTLQIEHAQGTERAAGVCSRGCERWTETTEIENSGEGLHRRSKRAANGMSQHWWWGKGAVFTAML